MNKLVLKEYNFHDLGRIFIELTSRCNMQCRFCPSPVLKRPRNDIKREHVLKILEELKNKNIPICFHVLGEPLLNLNLFEYMDICDKYNIDYYFITNGILCNPKTNQKLFSHTSLKCVEVSFHTLSEKSWILRGCKSLSFEQYLEKIKELVFCKECFLSGISLQLLIMYDLNMQEGLWNVFNYQDWNNFLDIVQSWAEELNAIYPEARARYPKYYAAKKVLFKRPQGTVYRKRENLPEYLFSDDSDTKYIGWEFFPNMFITAKQFFLFTKEHDYLQNAFSKNDCSINVLPCENLKHCELSKDITILSNGDISFCCLDYEGKLSCGNIENMTIAEAIHSPQRLLLQSNINSIEFCRQCKGEVILS